MAHKLGLPVAVISAARRKLNFLKEATSERDIRALNSLHFEKLQGKREGQCSIRLNVQWRLVFELNDDCKPPEIVILTIEDYH
ncbi:MAG: type II toxin-antitoxin system RelE/ParE family toxin [Mesorhizobium sp.]|uniref:type II toxin-antitoxin system RelE/ParE family toxin n=1 Tax=Mesorhizobium sp. TaxID=1871066 RepID=UPI001ACA9395|nr:type II toxin-antitoxin system RelE/ParE family toxin [Mesorhizobium sp.]MBN9223040.1 type II toxin-antitoxin system RelE/ParE family toxin [Mesorhizobium sp.]